MEWSWVRTSNPPFTGQPTLPSELRLVALKKGSAASDTKKKQRWFTNGEHLFLDSWLCFRRQRDILTQDINGRNPWSNYSTLCGTWQQRRWKKVYGATFLCSVSLSSFSSLSSVHQAALATIRTEWLGHAEEKCTVWGNYKRNPFSDFPLPHMKECL